MIFKTNRFSFIFLASLGCKKCYQGQMLKLELHIAHSSAPRSTLTFLRFPLSVNVRHEPSQVIRGSFNKSLENPRDGARSIENDLVLASIITYEVCPESIEPTFISPRCRYFSSSGGWHPSK